MTDVITLFFTDAVQICGEQRPVGEAQRPHQPRVCWFGGKNYVM